MERSEIMKRKVLLGVLSVILVLGIGMGVYLFFHREIFESNSTPVYENSSFNVEDIEITEKEEAKENILNKNATLEKVTFNKDKINVYLFWGNGCPHCEHLVSYLEEIYPEYQEYFDFYGFETWENEENEKLRNQVNEKFNLTSTSVPFLIIGKETIIGFNASKKESILNSIKSAYESTDRYDVLKEIVEK